MDFIKNITSKDINLSKKTILDLINSADLAKFRLLVEKEDFIFPFLKERISKDFVNLINKENLNTLFEFTKVYSFDFEEMIIKSFLKFANEDLTDEILEIFQTGTNEQKAYCAKYFCYIKDPLALDFLYENSSSDFNPLKTNCILALKSFNDTKLADLAKESIKNSTDEFEKLNDFETLSIFNEVDFIIENGLNSPLNSHIVSILLNYNDFDSLKNKTSKENLKKIFQILIENYPENISLDTVLYYQILDFIKLISLENDNYSKNLLLFAKGKFSEFNSNDIYTFDFDKSTKNEIKNISKFLENSDFTFNDVVFEYNNKNPHQFSLLLYIIKEYNIEKFDENLIEIFGKVNCEFKAQIAEILKSHNKINELDKNLIENIENENVKALILSYLC